MLLLMLRTLLVPNNFKPRSEQLVTQQPRCYVAIEANGFMRPDIRQKYIRKHVQSIIYYWPLGLDVLCVAAAWTHRAENIS